LLDVAIAALLSSFLAVLFTVLLYIRGSKKVIEPEQDLASLMFDEFSKKVSKVEGQNVDLRVSIDILEMQIERLQPNLGQESHFEAKPFLAHTPVTSHVITKTTNKSIGVTELDVLHIISSGDKTSKGIQLKLGKSREHTARVLKKLSETGFLVRGNERPFIYNLSEKGTAAVAEGME
jgi:hypothetical protein